MPAYRARQFANDPSIHASSTIQSLDHEFGARSSAASEPAPEQAIVLADTAGTIRYWSHGAAQRFGFHESEAVGRTLDLLVPPEHREAHWRGFRRAIDAGHASVDGQNVPFPALHANGEITERIGRVTMIRSPAGAMAAVIVVFA